MAIAAAARVRQPAPASLGARLDAVLVGVVAILAAGGVAGAATGLAVRVVAPSLDLTLDSVTTLVTMAVAALGWVRFRAQREPIALFQAAAFLVLAIANGVTLALVLGGLDRRAGMALSAPGQAPLYVFTFADLIAATLLVLGGLAALRRWQIRRPMGIMLAAALMAIVLIVIAEEGAPDLPALGVVSASVGVLPVPTLWGAGGGRARPTAHDRAR